MSTTELDRKVKDLRELRRMADELAAEIETAQDAIKAELSARGTDEARGTDWRITWKPVTSDRIDSKSLRVELPDVAARYMKQITTRRFVLA